MGACCDSHISGKISANAGIRILKEEEEEEEEKEEEEEEEEEAVIDKTQQNSKCRLCGDRD